MRLKPKYEITMSDENKDLLQVAYSDNIFKDASAIIEQSRSYAYRAVNVAMIQRNWLLGKRMGIPGTVRASFALYNTMTEVDALVAAVDRVRKMF